MTGLGLPGMKERVEMNHGKFELTSEVNNGLTIDINYSDRDIRCRYVEIDKSNSWSMTMLWFVLAIRCC